MTVALHLVPKDLACSLSEFYSKLDLRIPVVQVQRHRPLARGGRVGRRSWLYIVGSVIQLLRQCDLHIRLHLASPFIVKHRG